MLIGMQKIIFITHFFLRILQRYGKLVMFGNLGMPDHTHLKRDYQWKMNFPEKKGFLSF